MTGRPWPTLSPPKEATLPLSPAPTDILRWARHRAEKGRVYAILFDPGGEALAETSIPLEGADGEKLSFGKEWAQAKNMTRGHGVVHVLAGGSGIAISQGFLADVAGAMWFPCSSGGILLKNLGCMLFGVKTGTARWCKWGVLDE